MYLNVLGFGIYDVVLMGYCFDVDDYFFRYIKISCELLIDNIFMKFLVCGDNYGVVDLV